MPVRIAQEELGNVGDIGLDEDFRIVVPIEVMPGTTSLPHSYLVTLDSMRANVFFTLANNS
jgi:hypothetical protein